MTPKPEYEMKVTEKERKLIGVLQSDAPPQDKAITCKHLAIYGTEDAVPALARCAAAAPFDALFFEVHPDPPSALSDGPQSLRPEKFASLMQALAAVAEAVGRRVRLPNA